MESYRRLLHHHPAGVLTIQLPFDPSDAAHRGFEARLTDARHEAERQAAADLDPTALAAAFAHVEARVTALSQPPARSVLYVATADGLLHVRYSPLALPLRGRFARQADVGPFILADSARPRGIGVLLTDAEAVLFEIDPGRPNPADRLDDVVPAHQSAGGWSQARYQRHRNQHAREHIQRVTVAVEHALAEDPARWLATAGPAEARAALERALSGAAGARLAGHFRGEFHEPVETLEERAMDVLLAAQDGADDALVGRLVDDAAAGGRAALGWAAVLPALAEGAVQRLFCAADPASMVGSVDANGHLSAVAVGEPSWMSGQPTVEVAELPGSAVLAALRTGAQVQGLRAPAADRLEAHDGVAAELRHV